jgi:hypothetical protein
MKVVETLVPRYYNTTAGLFIVGYVFVKILSDATVKGLVLETNKY